MHKNLPKSVAVDVCNNWHNFGIFVIVNSITSLGKWIRLLVSSMKIVWILLISSQWVCKLLAIFSVFHFWRAKSSIVRIDIWVTTSTVNLVIYRFGMEHRIFLQVNVVDFWKETSRWVLVSWLVHGGETTIRLFITNFFWNIFQELNVSINKKPFFVTEVVVSRKC